MVSRFIGVHPLCDLIGDWEQYLTQTGGIVAAGMEPPGHRAIGRVHQGQQEHCARRAFHIMPAGPTLRGDFRIVPVRDEPAPSLMAVGTVTSIKGHTRIQAKIDKARTTTARLPPPVPHASRLRLGHVGFPSFFSLGNGHGGAHVIFSAI